ncbi:hypothetical protein C8R44DRAFT_742886 [Mycena epipterygia]|nr:hypothetical protein C8R44DRAFT_742886 [Mycena epipterygia]
MFPRVMALPGLSGGRNTVQDPPQKKWERSDQYRGVQARSSTGGGECEAQVSSVPSADILDFAAEVLPGGERVNIVIRMRKLVSPYVCFVEVATWDFGTGITELLSMTECAESRFHVAFLPTICRGFAAVRMYSLPSWVEMYLVIDFHTQRCCKILLSSHIGSNFRMELVPEYFILTLTPPAGAIQEIRVCAIASLHDFWAPVGQYSAAAPVALSNISHVASSTIKQKGVLIRRRALMQMVVLENPLQSGSYRVWLYLPYFVTSVLGRVINRAQLCSFCLALPEAGGRQLIWRKRSCVPATTEAPDLGITYSGHTQARMWRPGSQRIYPPKIHPVPILVEGVGSEFAANLHLAPYSGALASLSKHAFVLRYFE